MEAGRGTAVATLDEVHLTLELCNDDASDDELDSSGLSRCSTYSYNPADFPRACEIEEFMSPSFQWPDSSCASFASRPSYAESIQKTTFADTPSGNGALVFPARKIKFSWWRRRKMPHSPDSVIMPGPAPDPLLISAPDPDPLLFVAPRHLVRFTFQELKAATANFSCEISGLYSDGKAYKGLLPNDSHVAVQKCGGDEYWSRREFEAQVMGSVPFVHRNLLQLLGFYVTRTEGFLVYPYMANGNVKHWLSGRAPSKPPLDWATRLHIALGTARGLSYLHNHCHPKIIHRNLKTRNIFLDEDFEPLLGGFDLAFLTYWDKMHDYDTTSDILGDIPPELKSTTEILEKTDVFNYGVMLLEVVTGKTLQNDNNDVDHVSASVAAIGAIAVAAEAIGRADVVGADGDNDENEHDDDDVEFKAMLKKKYLEPLVDPDLHDNYMDAEKLIQIALHCAKTSFGDRPNMSEVLRMLEVGRFMESWTAWKMFVLEAPYITFNLLDDARRIKETSKY